MNRVVRLGRHRAELLLGRVVADAEEVIGPRLEPRQLGPKNRAIGQRETSATTRFGSSTLSFPLWRTRWAASPRLSPRPPTARSWSSSGRAATSETGRTDRTSASRQTPARQRGVPPRPLPPAIASPGCCAYNRRPPGARLFARIGGGKNRAWKISRFRSPGDSRRVFLLYHAAPAPSTRARSARLGSEKNERFLTLVLRAPK